MALDRKPQQLHVLLGFEINPTARLPFSDIEKAFLHPLTAICIMH